MGIDIPSTTQHTACERFLVWQPVSTSYMDHLQAGCTGTWLSTETKCR